MKVVRSKRLETILKDPKAAQQLREFLATTSIGRSKTIHTKEDGKGVDYVAKLVSIRGKD